MQHALNIWREENNNQSFDDVQLLIPLQPAEQST